MIMSNLKISETKDYFLLDGKPFFYLADTCWSAFTNATLKEWEEYLDCRKKQGFNVLQLNILPQHDRSIVENDLLAFEVDEEGKIDFTKYNYDYFNKASKMLDMAVERDFIPALVLLWSDYVAGTWLAKKPELAKVMPLSTVEPYIEFVTKTFAEYSPIYLVSGDSDFKEDITVNYYQTAMEVLKDISPNSLVTLHPQGEDTAILPDNLAQSDDLDFYMYQSSHALENQHFCYSLAEEYNNRKVTRPVINGEPCYEGMRYGTNNHGRFSRFHMRNAMWQSFLAGAKAGFTYGAHGIWSFHKKGSYFRAKNFAYMPFDWRVALRFEGAWDVSFGKFIIEEFNLFDLKPCDELRDIDNSEEEVRLAISENKDKIAIYLPFITEVKIKMDLSDYEMKYIQLKDRLFTEPEVDYEERNTILKASEFNSDMLFIAVRK